MIGNDNSISQKPGKGCEKRRAYGVNMHDIRPILSGLYQGQKGMYDGFKTLFMGRKTMNQLNTPPFFSPVHNVGVSCTEHNFVPFSDDTGK